jgi:hypothetical protein
MRKNIILIVLLLILVALTYNYISARYRIDYLSKQIDDHSISTKSRITLYESEDKVFNYLLSDDNKLWIGFTYDEHGINKSFWVNDDLSGKEIGFNFMVDGDGELASFFYRDKQYYIATNVLIPEYHQKLIEREEWVSDLRTIYTLFPDGTTEIRTESGGLWP